LLPRESAAATPANIPLTVTISPPGNPVSSSAPAPAWSDAELSKNPHSAGDKPERVRRMFAAIAGSYDLNNRLHSMWQDQLWRRFAVRKAQIKPGERVLDVACGTGDLSEWFARGVGGEGAASVTGVDFTAEMLDIARQKAKTRAPAWHAERITYLQGDAQDLKIETASVDVVSIAFGIRNVLDTDKALREFRRVLRPGGRLMVLEFAEPRLAPVRWFNNLYSKKIMPITATWIAGDRSGAYKYLPKSVSTFWTPEELTKKLEAAGFRGVQRWPLSLGICVCYRAEVA
jgi:demethylmenaquinone methyltransferase / 2-methoxy-6-polyprenyl-1,4-benzoquinol methylase